MMLEGVEIRKMGTRRLKLSPRWDWRSISRQKPWWWGWQGELYSRGRISLGRKLPRTTGHWILHSLVCNKREYIKHSCCSFSDYLFYLRDRAVERLRCIELFYSVKSHRAARGFRSEQWKSFKSKFQVTGETDRLSCEFYRIINILVYSSFPFDNYRRWIFF